MPTVVYVDVLLFINTITTYAVLITAERLFKRDTVILRLIAASLIGSLFSLLIFVGVKSVLFSLAIKIGSSLLITLIAFPFVSKRAYLKTALGVVASSILYSGFFILIYQWFRPRNMLIINDIVYFEFNPLVMIGCTAVLYTVITVLQKLFRERIKSTVVRLRFFVNSQEYACTGKVDTGCSLTEPFSGAPVIIVDASVMPIGESDQKRVIPYSTVNSSSILYAVRAEKVLIDSVPIEKEIYLASAPIRSGEIQAIINSDIVR